MKAQLFKPCFYYLTCLCLLGRFSLVAQTAVEAPAGGVATAPNTSPLCSKDILMTFFPKPILKAVLLKHGVSTEQAEEISTELAQKDQEVIKGVEEKASKMDPNPFKDLTDRDQALKVFKEVLFDVFANTVKKHGIEDEAKIQTILDDMQSAKGKLFVECMQSSKDKEKLKDKRDDKQVTPTPNSTNNGM